MPRPRTDHPTPAELEVLQVIWRRGPLTVRQVMTALNDQRPRAYTSVMSLMSVMTDKGLLSRRPMGRAYVYSARAVRDRTRSRMLKSLLRQAFDGSAGALVTRVLQDAKPSREELDEIHRIVQEMVRKKGGA